MRMRPGSMTAKWPGQSSRPDTISAMVRPAAAGGGIGRRASDDTERENFAKVEVEGEEDSVLAHCTRQHVAIRTAGGIAADPGDIVAGRAQGRHGIAGDILVGKKAHASGGASGRQRIDLFGLQHLARIG